VLKVAKKVENHYIWVYFSLTYHKELNRIKKPKYNSEERELLKLNNTRWAAFTHVELAWNPIRKEFWKLWPFKYFR